MTGADPTRAVVTAVVSAAAGIIAAAPPTIAPAPAHVMELSAKRAEQEYLASRLHKALTALSRLRGRGYTQRVCEKIVQHLDAEADSVANVARYSSVFGG